MLERGRKARGKRKSLDAKTLPERRSVSSAGDERERPRDFWTEQSSGFCWWRLLSSSYVGHAERKRVESKPVGTQPYAVLVFELEEVFACGL